MTGLKVFHSANHCRQSVYLNKHTNLWLNLLSKYIKIKDIPDRFSQKTIYELLWLSLRPELVKELVGTLIC